MKHESTHGYPAGYTPVRGEEGVHGSSHFRTPPIKSVTAGCATGGGGPAHGHGHKGSQRDGCLRNSGVKGAHRIGRKR